MLSFHEVAVVKSEQENSFITSLGIAEIFRDDFGVGFGDWLVPAGLPFAKVPPAATSGALEVGSVLGFRWPRTIRC